MSVNLKLRKSAQTEQEAPAPELVMAGGQTPWGPTPTTPPPSGNPFAPEGAAHGFPSTPPPPPPFAPGDEDSDTDAPSGRKANPKLLAAAVAVVVALGGGYFYLQSGSDSGASSATPTAAQIAANRARLAAIRAKAAAGKAATTGTTAAAGKPAATSGGAPAKPAAPAKAGTAKAGAPAKPAAAKPVTPAKAAAAKPAAPAKPATAAPAAPAKPAAAAAPVMHAALPGQIGVWSKLVVSKAPKSLVKYDPSIGTTLTNLQLGYFGGTADNPSALVVVADHPANAKLSALKLLRQEVPSLRFEGFVVAEPEAVSDPLFSGNAACTTATRNDVLGVACMWSDAGTWGFVLVPHTADSQKIDILDTVRASVER